MTLKTECDHPKDKVEIVDTASDAEVGSTPPRFWTIIGECECGELVEIDYEFNKITD